MEYRPKELYQIVDWYKENGYLEVPGYYSEKGNYCRLCGWKNDSEFSKECPNCRARYEKDKQDKQFPLGFAWMNFEDWLIVHTIDMQGERAYATLEEFSKNIKARAEHLAQWSAERQAQQMQASHRNNSLYTGRNNSTKR